MHQKAVRLGQWPPARPMRLEWRHVRHRPSEWMSVLGGHGPSSIWIRSYRLDTRSTWWMVGMLDV